MRLPDAYVAFLERRLGVSLKTPDPRELEAVAADMTAMSFRLTRPGERRAFVGQSYLDEPALRKAYLLYYTPVNLPKIFLPLSEMAVSGFFEKKPTLRWLDLGAGTGALSLGIAFWMRENFPSVRLEGTAVDQSGPALTEAGAAMHGIFGVDLQTVSAPVESFQSPAGEAYDLIVAGNVLNELSSEEQDAVVSLLETRLSGDGFVVLIEPAMRETSRTLLTFRDRLSGSGWRVYAPCVTQQSCPALSDPEDWCHHSVPWDRPSFIAWIDERTGTIKKSLKFSYIVLTRKNQNVADFAFGRRDAVHQIRIVSERFDEKGRTRVFGCHDGGRHELVMNTRDKTSSNQAFMKLGRYDLVELENVEPRKNDWRVGKTCAVTRWAGPPYRDPGSAD